MSNLENAISTLVSRLEAVTKRLEGVEKQIATGGAAGGGGAGSGEASAVSVQEYQVLIDTHIAPLTSVVGQLGDAVLSQQAGLFAKAVQAQLAFLQVAADSKKPKDDVFTQLLKPTSDLIAEIVTIKDKNRTSKFFNHLSTIAEGVGALGWVCVSPTPGPHVADMKGGAMFYSNKILTEFKGKNQTQVDFVTHFVGFLTDLQTFIKKNHTTGLTWNPKGAEASAGSARAAAPSSGGAPPPPPAAPAPLSSEDTSSKKPNTAGLFAALNQGTAITGGLKKVTSDMKTKNRDPNERSAVVPAEIAPKSTSSSSSAAKPAATKPPKFALEGNKWAIEWQNGNKSIVIEDTEAKQTVYIYKCKDTVVQIKGKVNSIALDDCQKTAVVFETVVSQVEMVNCKSIDIQVTGKVPSIAVDKTSGAQLYLSANSLDVEIVTSKSDSLNVVIPDDKSPGDIIELPVPEQYKTVVRGNKLVTDTVKHEG